jgi:hypothetical protein
MPLPLILLDIPPAIEQQVVERPVVEPGVWRSQPEPGAESTGVPGDHPTGDPVNPESSIPGSFLSSPSPWVDGAIPTRPQPVIEDLETDGLLPAEPAAADPLNADPLHTDDIDGTSAAALILRADRQVFEPERQIVNASGDVLVQFGNAQLAADQLWVNLNQRYLRAEGNVFFNRNQQIIEGDTATYNLLQGAGTLTNGRGSLQVSTLGEDFSATFPNDQLTSPASIDYRLQEQGSISDVTSRGGLSFSTDARQSLVGGEGGEIRRLRFETSNLSFDAEGWYGEDLRLTNDPFSPPELEFRSNQVRFTPINEDEDELCFDSPRFVFDQGLTIPVLRRCYILQRGQLPADTFNPLPTNIGYDGRDRDGLFIEREFQVSPPGPWRVTVSPQFYISRWLGASDLDLADLANFGVVTRLRGSVGPRTTVNGIMSLPGLDLQNFTERVRASLRAQHRLGTHRLNLEYTYRDRLFNGSLGFQDVQTSAGILLESPIIPLGNTRINLSYQASGQYVTANTDRPDLLEPGTFIGLASLFRFQGAVDLSRRFVLWRGQPRPSTPTEGLRYTPQPLVPSVALSAGLRGVATYYTSNDVQETLEARIALTGQLGHLARNYFDYTQFNLGFSSRFIGGDSSPFLFDRVVDQNIVSGGIIQQIYGPILAGFQTSFNLDTGQEIDTNLILEYRRRTYGLLIRYSPIQETGFLGFRLSNFNWTGRTERFDGAATNEDVVVQ